MTLLTGKTKGIFTFRLLRCQFTANRGSVQANLERSAHCSALAVLSQIFDSKN
jgi:hypothetical protein